MKKVHQYLGKANPIPGDFGIEIEAEGEGLQEVHNKFWKTEADGSLRGRYPEHSAEFVLKKPIKRDDVVPAIESLIAELPEAKFNFSFRTSVHIHMNVQDLTEDQVLNLMYVYLLLEEPLVNFCGRERKGNRFCLRVVDAEGMVEVITRIFERGLDFAFAIDENSIRYSSLNIAALRKYGSLEFRAMRGNIDKDVIKNWTEALYALKQYAITKKNPKEVLEDLQKLEFNGFVQKILGPLYPIFSYPRMIKEMQRSFSLTLDLPYSYKDQEEVVAPAPKKKALFNFDDLPVAINNPAGEIIARPAPRRAVPPQPEEF